MKEYESFYQASLVEDYYDDTDDDEYWSSLIDWNEFDGYLKTQRDHEIIENDKRVTDQYDEIYFELLEWIKYLKYLAAVGIDKCQIERRWKLNKISKIMNGK